MLPAIISISLVQALTHTVLVHVPAHTRTLSFCRSLVHTTLLQMMGLPAGDAER